MSVLKIFKNTPGCSPIGRQVLSVIFFSNSQLGPWKKKKALSPPQRATGGPVAPAPSGDQWAQHTGAAGGPVAPPSGDRGKPPYIRSNPPLPSSFEPENSTKNPEKKRGVRRRKTAKPCRIHHL